MFINWGHETPEQLAIRRRMEEAAMLEQAAFIRATRGNSTTAVSTAGVGGGSLQTKVVDPTENGYVENGYVENYFE